MTTPTTVQYCPQANEPGGGANPPATFEAEVLEVERPFCVTLLYAVGEQEVAAGSAITVPHVPAAGPTAKDPVPGCYQPNAGTPFPIGYVQTLGAEAGGMAEGGDDDEEEPQINRSTRRPR